MGVTRSMIPEIAKRWTPPPASLVDRRSATRTTARARALASTQRWSRGTATARRAIFARSFARIHETNLKKQGVLPLTFANPADWEKIGKDTRVSIIGLADLTPDVPVTVELHQSDGTVEVILCNHTMSPEHIEWFRAGGALNLIRASQAAKG